MATNIGMAAAIAFGVGGVMAVDAGADLVRGPQVEPRELVLMQFGYGDGVVTQQLGPRSGGGISAEWSASVTDVSKVPHRVLCSGSNKPGALGNYVGDVDHWSLDEWTGDDCPDTLPPGSRLEAVWTYQNEFGITVSTSTKLTVE